MTSYASAQNQIMHRIDHSLERLNSTLSSLAERMPPQNSWQDRENLSSSRFSAARENHALHNVQNLNGESFHASFEQSLDLAFDALQNFSQNSKYEIHDLTSFIGKSMNQVNFGNLLTNPLQSISSVFTAKAHSGGFVSDLALPFQSDEVPIIAKRGEAIFTPEQLNNAESVMKNAQEKRDQVTVHIHNHAGNVEVQAEEQNTDEGNTNIDIVISEAENLMARRIALGSGLASVIESRYGVMPRPRGGR